MWTILSAGQKNPAWLEESISTYQKRIIKPYKLEFILCPTHKDLIKKIPKNNYIIGLDPKGKSLNTEDFSKSIEKIHFISNNIVFIIGGAMGLDKNIKSHCQQLWSLSNLTFPHKLAMLILTEQLYRVSSILNNHPYHK